MGQVATVPPVAITPARRRALQRRGRDVATATTARNDEILAAANEGATLREIAEAVGLSFAGVKKIIDRHNAKNPRRTP